MKVLVACEFSGVVRDAFAARGHDAWSCDLLESERAGQHIVGDAREVIEGGAVGFAHCAPAMHGAGSKRCALVQGSARRTGARARVRHAVLRKQGAARGRRKPRFDSVESLPPAGLHRAAMAARARRDEGNVLLAARPAAAGAVADCRGPRTARAYGIAWAGPLEGTKPDIRRHRSGDGGPVGQVRITRGYGK